MVGSVSAAFVLGSYDIMGLSIASGDRPLVAAALADRITTQTRTQLAFVNANLSNVCYRDDGLREALAGFILLNDGVGVDLAAKLLLGRCFPDNLNGTDFVPALLDQETHSWRIFLLGARQEVIERAAKEISRRWPHHTVVGYANGYLEQESDLAGEIRDSRPHLVLVGMGNPRQELWIARNIPSVCNCAVAVGAWFDFLTGAAPRAPMWIRALRLEWLFRLWHEPARLAERYILGNTLFLTRVFEARFGLPMSVAMKRSR